MVIIGTLITPLAVVLPIGEQGALASSEDVRVIAVRTDSAPDVSMIIAAQRGPSANPLSPNDVSVSVHDTPVPTTVTPMASPSLSVALVVDTASDLPADTLQDVQSGATEFLLRLPTGAHSMVISAGDVPRVAAPLAREPVQALSAISALRPAGTGSVAAGVILAAESLAIAGPGPRAIVVFSNGSDQLGPPATNVANAMSRTETVISVIQMGSDDYWPQVLERSGGNVVTTGKSDVVQSFRRVSTAMSNQYVVAFKTPSALPTAGEVAVRRGDVVSRTVVDIPSNRKPAAANEDSQPTAARDSGLLSAVSAGLLFAALGLVALLVRDRRGSRWSYRSRTVAVVHDTPSTTTSRLGPRSAMTEPRYPEHPSGTADPAVSSIGAKRFTTTSSRPKSVEARFSGLVNPPAKEEKTLKGPDENPPPHQAENRHLGGASLAVAGSGHAVVQLAAELFGASVLHIKGNADSRYFGVRTEAGYSLVNTTDPYDGLRLLDRDRDKATTLHVQATGPWTIEVRTLRDVPTFDTSYSGDGDAVVRYTGNRSTARITGNEACGYFGVRCITADGTVRLANTTRAYSKSHPLNAIPHLFEIQAVGSWSITVS